MNRLELLNKMTGLEQRKTMFKNMLNDVSDYYVKDVYIKGFIETNARKKSYNEELICVNKDLFKDYLVSEIDTLNAQVNKLIAKLNEVTG